MAALKTLAVGVLLCLALARGAQADAITWHWTSWSPSGQMVNTENTSSFPLAPSVTTPAPSQPLPVSVTPVVPTADAYAWQNLGRWATTSPISTYVPPSTPVPLSAADGFVDMGSGPYPAAALLTSGGAQPWWTSPVAAQVFGGVPNAQQRADFSNTVLQRVEQTYQQSGVPVNLTTDPSVPAAHTLSVVSNTTYGPNPNVAGITSQGSNGFSFIDKFGAVQSLDQLEWLVAHNVAHELMHAFGTDHHDTTGTFLDSGIASWSLMLEPNARFSPAAVQDLLSKNFQTNTAQPLGFDGQIISASPVPEPLSLALWSLAVTAFGVGHRLRRRSVRA